MYMISKAEDPSSINGIKTSMMILANADVSEDDWRRCQRAEVWCSSIKDGGADYCELRLFDAQAALFSTIRIEGY